MARPHIGLGPCPCGFVDPTTDRPGHVVAATTVGRQAKQRLPAADALNGTAQREVTSVREQTCKPIICDVLLCDACGLKGPTGQDSNQMRAVRRIGVVVLWWRRALGS